jgi:hypothetical protein
MNDIVLSPTFTISEDGCPVNGIEVKLWDE